MKKLLLLSALAMGAMMSQAATFTVSVKGENVENGATVNFDEVDFNEFSNEVPGYGTVTTTLYQIDPEIYASASEATNVDITVENLSENDDWTSLQYCWPSDCIVIAPGKSQTNSGILPDTPTCLEIHTGQWTDKIEQEFTVSCKISIVSKSNASDSFSFTLNMLYNPEELGGVEGIDADLDVPATYYDLAGRKVADPQPGQLVIERKGAKATKKIYK